MNTYDINNNQHVLAHLLDRALLDTVIWTAKRCKPQEPDYVAALSTNFVRDFFNILVAVFPNYDFSVLGIYCHQKPIVDIKLDKRPELGDILFVYANRKRNRKMVLNSLLLQAKISSRPLLKIHSGEVHQLELYRKWPEFTYYRAGRLNGTTRNILPKTINDGAQYLLIDDNPLTNGIFAGKGMFPMGCAIPDDTLYINDSLSNELIDLLKFKSGRTFDNDPLTKDGWSQMIWDLLRIVANKYSKRRNAKIKSFPRSHEYCHFCTESMRNTTLLDELLDINRNTNEESDEDAGVSVVLIESRAKSEFEE